ncbi:MAG: tRNA threonylcarbamoyladenosine dehydratase [Desulfamplus sp.]|nr:tRNA threonylcarbamoyladenosine dehydratase [Desulfamplus sp.]
MKFNREKFKRTELLLGSLAMDKLEKSTVTVVGLGAVGSHVIESLARSGIGKLRIVDFDEIGISNFNRQLLALESNIGTLKTKAAFTRLKQINPDIDVECFNTLCHKETFDLVFSSDTDIVVDAIDSLNPKVNILYELTQRNIPVISSMGAARRKDPSAIKIGDISETMGCPLARSVRKRLRRMGVDNGIRCVYSTEIAPKDTVSNELEDNYFDSGRLRNPMGSLSMISGIFGYTVALEVLKIILYDLVEW